MLLGTNLHDMNEYQAEVDSTYTCSGIACLNALRLWEPPKYPVSNEEREQGEICCSTN